MNNSNHLITQHISNADLKAYFVGFDFGKYRYDDLVDTILDKIVEFSFGYHMGINPAESDTAKQRRILINAAKSIYNASDIFSKTKEKYVDENSEYEDDIEEKYLKRGEFGELILHLILKDFIKTLPLISKIHFKDSDGVTIHGFDAVHIGSCINNINEKSLYLGESKLYKNGLKGVKELISDIEKHFKIDFLKREFALIGKKSNNFVEIDYYKDINTKDEYKKFLQEKNYWFTKLDEIQTGKGKMQDLLNSVTIPLLCTYTSKLFKDFNNEKNIKFQEGYASEIGGLKFVFDKELKILKKKYEDSGEPISTNLNIVLMLFPVPCKKELVKRLHTKLYHQQNS